MNIQSLKIELVKRILELESEEVLSSLFQTLKKEDKDFWLELSEEQKEEVEIGLRQIENGETEDFDDFLKRVS